MRTDRNHRGRLAALPILLGVALLLTAVIPATAAGKIFELKDPRGDDHGNGRLVYPLNNDFNQGDLDLISFSAERTKGGTIFEITFARPVRQPPVGAMDELGTPGTQLFRHGFYTFNVDIYIDTDRLSGSGGVAMLPGRKAVLSLDHAWDRAVILTPRPFEAQELLSRIFVNTLSDEMRDARGESADKAELRVLRRELSSDLARRIYFPNQIRVRGNKIRFTVPDSFLGEAASPEWSYTVVVTGSDNLQRIDMNFTDSNVRQFTERFMNLPVSPDEWQNRFGGGREDDGLQPPIIDLIVPEGASQEKLLNDFDGRNDKPAELPGVVPAEQKKG